MKLITQIMLCLTVPLAMVFIIMCFTTLSVIIPTTISWGYEVKTHIENEEINNLILRTTNLRNLSSLNFRHISNDLILMRDYANDIYGNKLPIENYYKHYYVTDPGPPLDTNGLNTEYSIWFNKASSDPNTQTYLNDSSVMDNTWRALYKSNNGYAGLYIGFEDGLFRHLPYMDLSGFPTFTYTCIITNALTVGYDPRCRGWYFLAKNDQTKIHFTEPYSDAGTGNILISVSHAIVDSSNNFLGAVSVDISMQNLASAILSEKILDNGYTYLMDMTGKLVVYPGLDYDKVYTVYDKEFTYLSEKESFEPVFNIITGNTGNIGKETFIKNGEEWLSIFSKVQDTDYIVVMVVPNSDIVKAITDINILVGVTIGIATAIMIVITIVMIFISVVVNIISANKITKSIKKFDTVECAITKGKYDVELEETDETSPEFKKMGRYLKDLILAIRFGNKSYFKGDHQKAFENYMKVLNITKEFDNKIGEGVVLNNLGSVVMELDKMVLKRSEDYFNEAITNVEDILDSTKDNDKQRRFKITLANRYMNLGVLYVTWKKSGKAIEMYNKSISLHKQCDNKLDEITVMGNLGILYLELNDNAQAFGKFKVAFDVASGMYKDEQTKENANVLRYAMLNMGKYYNKTKDLYQALDYLVKGLRLENTIDINFQKECLTHMAQAYEKIGNNLLANKIRKTLNITRPKHVLFVLDVSGSMQGPPIRNCRESINTIIKNYMNVNDLVSLLKFQQNYSWVFKDEEIKGNLDDLLLTDKVNNYTQADGTTAFYYAVDKAIRHHTKMKKNNTREQWIVALTDGDDNESNKHNIYSNTVVNKIKEHGVNIIVITVGKLSNIREIKNIVRASKSGMHIEVKDGNNGVHGIKEAFTKAIKMINNRGRINIESL
uniref:VWFA domain-containing protein n=1 Tax=Mimivirus LCMiAC02 TaxID=2506609 RepID=A0A481Z1U7_9VIRU|nr:MAG: uncharacterized protein LCMiAC02_02950 [Mimivirus LCMiAC02]